MATTKQTKQREQSINDVVDDYVGEVLSNYEPDVDDIAQEVLDNLQYDSNFRAAIVAKIRAALKKG